MLRRTTGEESNENRHRTEVVRSAVPQRVSLVPRDAERRQEMEPFLQQWFKSAGRGVGRVKETVHLAAGWADLAHLNENETESSGLLFYNFQIVYTETGLIWSSANSRLAHTWPQET